MTRRRQGRRRRRWQYDREDGDASREEGPERQYPNEVPLEVACGREGEGCSHGVRQRADAALTEGELASAAWGSEHGFDETGGEAARSVGSVLGLGTKWGAGSRSRCSATGSGL